MLKIVGIVILIGIIIAVFKYVLVAVIRFTAIAVCSFLVIGTLTGFLALINVISTGTAWTLTLIAFFVGLAYNLYEAACRPSKALSDINEMYHKDYTPKKYDDLNKEIDQYKNKRYCGNCKHNMSRSPNHFWSIYCTWNSIYHNDLSFSQTDVCEHWEHF